MEKDKIFTSGKRYIPGGINELIIKSAKGVKLFDENDKEYIDFDLGGGSLILGHSNDGVVKSLISTLQDEVCLFDNSLAEVKISEFLCNNIDYIDMVKSYYSKEKAIEAAINLSKVYTKKDKVLTFTLKKGCNKGGNSIVCKFDDEKELIELFNKFNKEIAVALIEPISIKNGIRRCNPKFLKVLRTLCNKNGVILIFDEYVSAFRTSFKGIRGEYDVLPDLVIFGQVLNGGMGGAYLGGKRKIMDKYSEENNISVNTLSIVNGIEILNRLFTHPEYYVQIESVSKKLEEGLNKIKNKLNAKFTVEKSLGMIQLIIEPTLYNKYYHYMLEKGFNVPHFINQPLFICAEHNITHVFKYLKAFEEFATKELL